LNELIFKRKKRPPINSDNRPATRLSASAYNMALDVMDETGESMKDVVSKMIEHAYKEIRYEEDEQ